MDLLSLRDVSVTKDGVRVLDRVTWTVRAGERWVVLGSNGAGKTSLLHAAADAALCDLVGVVAELPLPPDQTTLASVIAAAYGRLELGEEQVDPADEQRAAGMLAQLGCRGLLARRVGALSEGERRRVLIARALMADPELLLLDEPAAGLDLGGREALLHWLSRLAADPAAPVTVLVTHHVEEIPAATTHALLLRAGRVVASGSVEDTLTSAQLSSCFGLPVTCERRDGRWTARLAAVG